MILKRWYLRNSSSHVELESLNPPATTKQRTNSNSSASAVQQQQPISGNNNNNNTKRSSVKSQHSGSIGSYNQATSVINTSPQHNGATSPQQQHQNQTNQMRLQIPQIQVMQSQPSSPFRLFRSSISSAGGARRESAVQFPDLMTTSNLFHSFQSKHWVVTSLFLFHCCYYISYSILYFFLVRSDRMFFII